MIAAVYRGASNGNLFWIFLHRALLSFTDASSFRFQSLLQTNTCAKKFDSMHVEIWKENHKTDAKVLGLSRNFSVPIVSNYISLWMRQYSYLLHVTHHRIIIYLFILRNIVALWRVLLIRLIKCNFQHKFQNETFIIFLSTFAKLF